MSRFGPSGLSVIERFWTHVEKSDGESCWLWHGSLNNKGYGMFSLNGIRIKGWIFALVGVVTFFAVVHSARADVWSAMHKPKLSGSIYAENVSVQYLPPGVQPILGTVLYGSDRLSGQNGRAFVFGDKVCSRRNDCFNHGAARIWSWRFLSERERQNPHIRPMEYVMGRRLPSILDENTKLWSSRGGKIGAFFDPHEKISAQLPFSGVLHRLNSFSSRVSCVLGCFSGHSIGLNLVPDGPKAENRDASRYPSYDSRSASSESRHRSPNQHPPIVRRFFIALGSLVGAFLCGFWSFKAFDDKRLVLSATLVICGLLIGFGGMGILWVTGFRWSWGWWI